MLDFEKRYRRFLEELEARCLDGMLVSRPGNLAYLFSFTGSSGLACCLEGETHLIVDSRYFHQAETESANCRPRLASESLEQELYPILAALPKGSRLGIEGGHLTHDQVLALQNRNPHLELISTNTLVEELRMLKEPGEIFRIERALTIANQAFMAFLELLRPGLRESEAAGILELECRKAGAEGIAFETIIASGQRSALPHGVASSKVIQAEEPVLIDFGLRYQGYCSDLTRMFLPPGQDAPETLAIVEQAQQAALEQIRPGVSAVEVDGAARQVISRHGFGDYFGHGTGHGLGIEVHELPRISPRGRTELKEGMVFTIEPGIYLPGTGGVRVEDVALVTATGCRLLSDR